MPDLTLNELSDLKKEEIKRILLKEYNIFRNENDTPEKNCSPVTAKLRNIKLSYQKILTHIVKQVKTILSMRTLFTMSIRNNP